MLARLVPEIPVGKDWVYEPKWDGFRCLAFRDGDRVELQSKSGQPLGRYFPEIVNAVRALAARQVRARRRNRRARRGRSVLRRAAAAHSPGRSRVEKLSSEFPGLYLVFDLLADEKGRSLVELDWKKRRADARGLRGAQLRRRRTDAPLPGDAVARRSAALAEERRRRVDGVIAKRVDLEYRSGDRTGMQKIKFLRTADCVVGGFRYASKAKVVGSLLLGLYDEGGQARSRRLLLGIEGRGAQGADPQARGLVKAPGFTGKAPGGPSRWSSERSARVEAARAEARRRGPVRPLLGGPLPPRHAPAALAPGQGPAPVHARAGGAGKRRAAARSGLAARPDQRPFLSSGASSVPRHFLAPQWQAYWLLRLRDAPFSISSE